MSVNKAILVGNVGNDPEVRHLEAGTPVANFSLATSETYKNRDGEKVTQTEWHNIVVWRGLAEVVEKYVRKGQQLFIEGRIRTRSWDDKDGNKRYTTEIVADTMQMLGRKGENTSASDAGMSSNNQSSQESTNSIPANEPEPEDDLPF
ncbi:MAG TPA: single-stranded DNA-binding protein [Bacteroidales bacterium]|jgi:single-strand DNA-binding protein|nr:single-stranded DNA-binding protein [Bacteroidales bacterium]